MDRLKRFIPLTAFCLYFGKVFFMPVTYTETVILLILAVSSCYFEFKNSDQQMHTLNKKLEEIQKLTEDRNKDIDHLKSAVASVKLSNGIRQVGNVNR